MRDFKRIRNSVVAGIGVCLAFGGYGRASGSDDTELKMKAFEGAGKILSPAAQYMVAQGIKGRALEQESSADYDKSASAFSAEISQDQITASLTAISAKYQKQRDEAAKGRLVLDLVNRGADVTLEIAEEAAGAIPVVGVVPKLALKAAHFQVNALGEEALKHFNQSALESSKAMLGNYLSTLPAQAWADWDSLSTLNPEEARKRGGELLRTWSKSVLSSIEDGEERRDTQAVFQGYMVEALAGQLAKEGGLRALADQYQDERLDAHAKNLAAISTALIDYSEATNSKLRQLSDQQQALIGKMEKMQGTLDEHGKRLDDITSDLGFMQEFMFGKMSPEEQLSALKRGMFPNMDDSRRKELMEKLEIVKIRMDIRQTAQDVFNGAQLLLNAAPKLGLDPNLVKTVQDVVKKGNQAFRVYDAITSGSGFFGVAGAVSELFGLGGPDMAQIRHEQIMSKLEQISQAQGQILENQKKLFETQLTLLKGQQAIFASVQKLAEFVEVAHRETMERLDLVHREILTNREMILAGLTRDTAMCEGFISPEDRRYTDGYDVATGRFLTYDALQSHFYNNSRRFYSCIDGLEATLGTREFSKATLFLKNRVKSDDSALTSYQQTIHKPAYERLKSQAVCSNPGQQDLAMARAYQSLIVPAASRDIVEIKNDRAKAIRGDAPEIRDHSNMVPLLGDPISVPAVVTYSNYLLETFPYLELVDARSGQLKDIDSVLNGRFQINQGEVLLSKALKWTHLAIAQEDLLSGNGVVPQIFSDLRGKSQEQLSQAPDAASDACGEVASIQASLDLLRKNKLLRENFIHFAIDQALKTSGADLISYHLALGQEGNSWLLEKVVPLGWKFQWSASDQLSGPTPSSPIIPKGWSVQLGDQYLVLPDAETLRDHRMVYGAQMSELLKLKASLIDVLTDFQVAKKLSPDERKVFASAMLRGA